jgi:hypothetical protein
MDELLVFEGNKRRNLHHYHYAFHESHIKLSKASADVCLETFVVRSQHLAA